MTTTTTPLPAFPIQHLDIPYTDAESKLQTLDIYLPRPLPESTTTTNSNIKKLWIIYVHGGAWRDPLQTSRTLRPTLSHFLPEDTAHIAGIASLNYRLSPYASHPSAPSTPDDPDRNAAHPEHVRDVARALRWLQNKHSVVEWVGVGHSCGATLLLQLCAGIGLESASPVLKPVPGPQALVLLEGIYSLPLLLSNHTPPHCSPDIAAIYHDIVSGAFGAQEASWRSASPVHGTYGREACPELRRIVLCYSPDDELVEGQQRDVMVERLEGEGWVRQCAETEKERRAERVVDVRDLHGSHDGMWEDGVQIQGLIVEVVRCIVGAMETGSRCE